MRHMLYLSIYLVVQESIMFVLSSDVSALNTISQKSNGLGGAITSFVTNFAASKGLISNFPDSGRQNAILELQRKESIPLQIDNKYGHLQEFVAGIFNPKPVVDRTEEYQKYGNDAGSARKVSTAVIGGVETLSNKLNAIVEIPFVASKQIGKTITASLNVVGGKLVGLS